MATEQRTTPEQRRALRARYTPEPEPRCPVCGGAMANDDDFGNIIPHRETWWRCPVHPEQRETTLPLRNGDSRILALIDDADALAGARAECERLRAKAETVIDVLDRMKSLAAHAEEMTPMLTEPAIWWGDMVALIETALGCAERMPAPGTGGTGE